MSAGRKRSFDKQEALDKAMKVFWENGYAGTSVAQLTSELGINKPSLYAAFGNKQQLFASALQRYMDEYAAQNMALLTYPESAPLKQRLEAYFGGVIDVICDGASPRGCMLVKSCCEAGSVAVPAEIRASLDELGLMNDSNFCEFLENEKSKGELADSSNPQELAEYLLSVIYGLSVLARQGKSRQQLARVADRAVATLP